MSQYKEYQIESTGKNGMKLIEQPNGRFLISLPNFIMTVDSANEIRALLNPTSDLEKEKEIMMMLGFKLKLKEQNN